jgi:N-terminal C2 in EEIG1 and EHBP1 proteins
VKWHLPSSTAAEHRGRTGKSPIKEHKVSWDYEKVIPVRLTMDKQNMLQECNIDFEVIQDYNSGARGEKITLGHVSLNLAEYAEDGITRRYLMQDSKINSTLKIGISMKQLDGERNFIAPPLKTAPVFGGIAGIMDFEQTEDDLGRKFPFGWHEQEC